MYFQPIEDPASKLIAYLLGDPDAREAVVIDPPPRENELILALLAERGMRLRYVLRTHVHQGAATECSALCGRAGAQLVLAQTVVLPKDCPHIPLRVGQGSRLEFGNEHLRVFATPGHTPACVSYLWRDRLFCGDVFDAGGCPAGDAEADAGMLFDSLMRRIFRLPEQTLVFPAHPIDGRHVATLAELRQHYGQMFNQSRDDFIADMAARGGRRRHLQRETPHHPARRPH